MRDSTLELDQPETAVEPPAANGGANRDLVVVDHPIFCSYGPLRLGDLLHIVFCG